MPKFEPKYTDKDFLQAAEGLKTIGFITKTVGCARMTTITYINKLVDEGKVQKQHVDEGQLFVYSRV
jgi:hypothetical protein